MEKLLVLAFPKFGSRAEDNRAGDETAQYILSRRLIDGNTSEVPGNWDAVDVPLGLAESPLSKAEKPGKGGGWRIEMWYSTETIQLMETRQLSGA